MARREEWQEQKRLARLLDRWLDPACTYWTATDPVASSALSGAIRKQRGVKPGAPRVLIWYRGKSIAIELKSRHGQCMLSQRAVRAALLWADVDWWVCRSADAAMWALYKSGVEFRAIVGGRWQDRARATAQASALEVPKRDPHERRPRSPEVAAERAAAHRRSGQRAHEG